MRRKEGKMSHTFDFNKIGKRMPYTVPEGFFEDMERNVMSRVGLLADTADSVAAPKGHRRLRVVAMAAVTAVAAGLLLLAVLRATAPGQPETTMSQIEETFASLSNEDQEFLLDMYHDYVYEYYDYTEAHCEDEE